MREPFWTLYKRYGEHLRPTRHPWVWGMGAYVILSNPLDLLWPWHGWSRRVAVTLLFIVAVGVTQRWAEHLGRR